MHAVLSVSVHRRCCQKRNSDWDVAHHFYTQYPTIQYTIAILHALANTPKHIQSTEIESSSWIQCFLQKCSTRSPTQRASHLENDTTIESYHESATDHVTNQTARPNRDDATDMHFASFVCVDGKLYELDGRLDDPICHGETIQPHLLKDSCGIVGKWMGADVDELRFTMLALCEVQR